MKKLFGLIFLLSSLISVGQSIQPIQWAPQTTGRTIYNKGNWVGTQDFVLHGAATLTLDNGFLDLAGSNTGSGNDFISFGFPTTGRYWTMTLKFLIKSNSVVYGIAGGQWSVNTTSALDIQGQFSTPSGTSQALIWRNHFSAQLGSTTNLVTVAVGDTILATVQFADSVINLSEQDITSHSSVATAQFVYTVPSGLASPNTCEFAIYSMAGVQQLQSIKVTEDDVFNANVLSQADSKGEFFPNNWDSTVTHQLQPYYPSVVTYAGASDQLEQQIMASKDVLLHNPVQILLGSGYDNSLRAADPLAYVETLYDSLYRIYTAAGITVYPFCLPEDSTAGGLGMTNFNTWMKAKYSNYIDTWDSLSTNNVLKAAYQYNSIHLNGLGNDKEFQAILVSGKLKNFTYRSSQVQKSDGRTIAIAGDSVWLPTPFVTSVWRKIGTDSTYFGMSDGSIQVTLDSLGSGSAPSTLTGTLTSGDVPVASGAHTLANGNATDNLTTFAVGENLSNTLQVNLATAGTKNVVIGGAGAGAYNLDVQAAGSATAFGVNGFISAYGTSAAIGVDNRNTSTPYIYLFSDPKFHIFDVLHSVDIMNVDTVAAHTVSWPTTTTAFNIGTPTITSGLLNLNGAAYIDGGVNTTGAAGVFSLHSRTSPFTQTMGLYSTATEVNFYDNVTSSNAMEFGTLGNVLMGTTTDLASSRFTVASTTQGSIPAPSMTTTQQNAISSPHEGLRVYDNVLHTPAYYNGTAWVDLSTGGSFTCTPSNTLNVSSATVTDAYYTVNNQIVTVTVSGSVTTTTALLNSQITLTLPVSTTQTGLHTYGACSVDLTGGTPSVSSTGVTQLASSTTVVLYFPAPSTAGGSVFTTTFMYHL